MEKKINNVETLLDSVKLKATPLRMRILEEILKSQIGMTQKEIIEKLLINQDQIDRVTVYRNLNLLKQFGLIHEVETNRYVSCQHQCKKHGHILLFCQNCEEHYEVHEHNWIEQLSNTLSFLNFIDPQQSLLIRGTCQQCTRQSK